MKRIYLLALVGIALVTGGCGPTLPPPMPPVDWIPPEVQSLVVAPAPVAAEAPFTLAVTAIDDTAVQGIFVLFKQPNGTYFYDVPCALGDQVSTNQFFLDDPQPSVSLEFTCQLPEGAPNGTWTVDMGALDSPVSWPGTPRTVVAFEVTGGV